MPINYNYDNKKIIEIKTSLYFQNFIRHGKYNMGYK